MKKIQIIVGSLSIALSLLLAMNLSVLADVSLNVATQKTYIVDVKNVPYNDESCSNIGGLSVTSTDSNRRMYVLKSSNEQNRAVLYFYSNYSDITESNYGKIELRSLVGHANAMAIDDNYIYITGWNSSGSNPNAKDDIIRISRTKIWNLYNSTTAIEKGYLNSNSDGVKIFSAVDSDGNAWNKRIFAITNYKENGKFIINDGLATNENGTQVLSFTTAEITNGNFVVSNSSEDVFSVDTGLTGTTGQDIGYSSSNGLFIPRWHDSTDNAKVKNTIIWIKLNSLSGTDRVYTKDNSKYRHIIVNESLSNYSKFEIESVCFNHNNDMYASVNVYPYTNSKDCVIKIRRATATSGGSYKFLGSNIDK